MTNYRKVTQKFYNEQASIWGKYIANSFWYEQRFRKFVSKFKSGDRVLDIGCAWGIHLPMFFGIGRKLRYIGMDISQSMLKMARSRFPQYEFLQGDILNFKTAVRLHGFWAAAVLMHIAPEDWPKMMQNLERAILPGGYGFISLPARPSGRAPKKDKRYFSFWNKGKVEKMLATRGWKIKSWGKMPNLPTAWYIDWTWYIVQLPK